LLRVQIVRDQAAINLGRLMSLSTRIDPLITDLVGAIEPADAAVQEALLRALHGVMLRVGNAANAKSLTVLTASIVASLASPAPNVQAAAATGAGSLFCHLPDDQATAFLTYVTLQ
jgi:hypothetical protein